MEHSRAGIVLFDSGLSPRLFTYASSLADKLYRAVLPVKISFEDTASARLKSMGIDASDVSVVICSHFHADHVGGAADFPRARYVFLEDGYRQLLQGSKLARAKAGFFPELLPHDFEQRAWSLVRSHFKPHRNASLTEFEEGVDLFGDGSLLVIDLPGHAAGHIGALVRTSSGQQYLLAADACWLETSYRNNLSPPDWVMRLIIDDRRRYLDTLAKLARLAGKNSELQIVPCHCKNTLPVLPDLQRFSNQQTEIVSIDAGALNSESLCQHHAPNL
ncbi:MAG: MBL fold metallo-hydrolase [Acidobacteriaceae bacterium]|nr:MBL fold metallo-hydrolase [Acidobacteriaceae bacterium]